MWIAPTKIYNYKLKPGMKTIETFVTDMLNFLYTHK